MRSSTEAVPGGGREGWGGGTSSGSDSPTDGSYRRKDSESCKKNKHLLKNLKGKRGSVYRARAGRKAAPRPADRVKID